MEIVVKHNQVEVSLQTPQRPLPNTVLAVASLKGGDQEGEWGGKDGAAGASQPPPQEGQELSLRNPQKTICSSLHHTVLPGWKFFQASNPAPFAADNR